MCTFNGAAWVGQQLRSFAHQRRLPDELIACDDCSTDGTAEILKDFAAKAPFEVKVVVNPQQLGVTANFNQSIGLCTGTNIALADQDDNWDPRKLEVLEQRLLDDEKVGLVFSDAQLVDELLKPLGARLWDTLYLDTRQRERLTNGQAVPVLARTNVVTGATMMFRAKYRPLILPISEHWVHDAWIALMVAAVGACAMVDEPLIQYRQHADQQIGARRTTLLEQVRIGLQMDEQYFGREVKRWEDALQRLQQNASMLRYPRDLSLLEEKARFSRRRHEMRVEPATRWNGIDEHWSRGDYAAMAWGWKSLMQDVVILR